MRKRIHNILDATAFTDLCGILQSSLLSLGMGFFVGFVVYTIVTNRGMIAA